MWRTYGIIILFAASYWIARIFTITPYWDGTDGNGLLANIFLHDMHGPEYLESAWADGKIMYAYPDHPAFLYEIPRCFGIFFNPLLHLDAASSITCALSLKAISALIQFVFYAVLFWLGLSENRGRKDSLLSCWMVILISLSPLALMSSNEFQTDTFSGVILIGGATFFLLAGARATHFRSSCVALVLAGIFLGGGKIEWSAAFFMAIVAVGFVGLCKRSHMIRLKALALAAGLIAGNVLSFDFDAANYLGGNDLLADMVSSHSAVGAPHTYHLFRTLSQILPYTITLLVLAAFSCSIGFLNREEIAAEHLMLFFSSMALFCGYTLSTWGLVSRYFYPSLILLSGLVYLLCTAMPKGKSVLRSILFFGAALLISIVYDDVTLFRQAAEIRAWSAEHGAIALKPLPENGAYLIDICFLLPNVDKNFVHSWVGQATISHHEKWARKKLMLDAVEEYPPYTTLSPDVPPHAVSTR